jgi:hypothetical protein
LLLPLRELILLLIVLEQLHVTGTATSSVTVSSSPTATVSGGTFCATGTTNLTNNGATGGTFSAAPAGLSINATTGVIDLAASTPELILLLIVLEQLHVMEQQQAVVTVKRLLLLQQQQ